MAEPRARARATRRDLISLPPAINVDQGQARAWGQLADTTYRMSVRVSDRLDEEAAVDAMRAGMSGDINDGLMFSPTVRGKAYTQQAIKSYWSNLEATARLRMDEIAAANRADPQGMQQAVDLYIENTTGSLPDEFKAKARSYLTATSRSHISSARAALVKQRQAQAEASGLLAERTATLEIDRLSSGLFSSDPESAAAAATGLDAVRARLAALYGSTVTDDLGNKVPVFSAEQRARAGIMLEERVAKGALTGWYGGQSNKLQALRAINSGQVRAPLVENGEVVGEYNPLASLGTEERDKLISKLRGAYSTELGIQSKLQAMADRERKKREDAALVNLYRTAANDPTAPVIGLALQLIESVDDPTVARQLTDMVRSGSYSGDLSDSAMFNIAKIDALQGRFDWRSDDYPGLTIKARAQLMDVNRQALDRAEGDRIFNDGDFLDARDLIAVQFGALDFESLRVQSEMGAKNPKLNTALGHIAALSQAKFDAELAGQPFSASRWYMENVREVADARVGVVETLRSEMNEAEAALRKYENEVLRGKSLTEQTQDPERIRLREIRNATRRRLQEAVQ